ncbi:DUF2237 domain-containing protein [Oligoflexaceae bacterium]|nr:DUF2237 domain-containing protein [Oligoflexaceae bacterium]
MKPDSEQQKNIYGRQLKVCSCEPMTGWFRDGLCRQDDDDIGRHTVCAVVTTEFLEFSKSRGNDLTAATAGFPGLKHGDKWCLCVTRWHQAHLAKHAPPLVLESCERSVLETVGLEVLEQYDATKMSIFPSSTKH